MIFRYFGEKTHFLENSAQRLSLLRPCVRKDKRAERLMKGRNVSLYHSLFSQFLSFIRRLLVVHNYSIVVAHSFFKSSIVQFLNSPIRQIPSCLAAQPTIRLFHLYITFLFSFPILIKQKTNLSTQLEKTGAWRFLYTCAFHLVLLRGKFLLLYIDWFITDKETREKLIIYVGTTIWFCCYLRLFVDLVISHLACWHLMKFWNSVFFGSFVNAKRINQLHRVIRFYVEMLTHDEAFVKN